jgi:hypothetical protein
MKLYRNSRYPNRWYAYSVATGWIMFPAAPNGWEKREPARGVDPLYTREVSLKLAAGTGMLESADADLLVAA